MNGSLGSWKCILAALCLAMSGGVFSAQAGLVDCFAYGLAGAAGQAIGQGIGIMVLSKLTSAMAGDSGVDRRASNVSRDREANVTVKAETNVTAKVEKKPEVVPQLVPDELVLHMSAAAIDRARKGEKDCAKCMVMFWGRLDGKDKEAFERYRDEITSRLGGFSSLQITDAGLCLTFWAEVVSSSSARQGDSPIRIVVSSGRVDYATTPAFAALNEFMMKNVSSKWNVCDAPQDVRWEIAGSAKGLSVSASDVSVGGKYYSVYAHRFDVDEGLVSIGFSRHASTTRSWVRPYLMLDGRSAEARAMVNEINELMSADPDGKDVDD